MSELKIDEKHIRQMCHDLTHLMHDIVKDIESVEDKNNDVFTRYMSMVRLGAIFMGAKQSLNMSRHLFTMGFDVQHEVFQTKAAKENGWDKCRIEDNPFFVNINNDDNDSGIKVEFKELPDELKEIIVNAIRAKFGANKPEQTH
jgi:Tfp pilus assembly protein PilZ